MKHIFIYLFILGFFSSCKLKNEVRPAYIIPEHKFVRVLIDYHLAQGLSSSELFRKKADNFKEFNLADSVLKRHGYDRAAFDSTMAFYSNDPEKLGLLYDEVLNELNKKHADVQIEMEKQKKAEKK